MRRRSRTNSRQWEDLSLRFNYREDNPLCELGAALRGTVWCQIGGEVHHVVGNFGQRCDLMSNLISACRPCHDWCHENDRDARLICAAIKIKKDELDVEEWKTASGKVLAGYAENATPTHPAAVAAREFLLEWFRE